jgi:hypothetical protein
MVSYNSLKRLNLLNNPIVSFPPNKSSQEKIRPFTNGMAQELSKSALITQVSNGSGAGQTAVNSAVVDMQGFGAVCFIATLGAVSIFNRLNVFHSLPSFFINKSLIVSGLVSLKVSALRLNSVPLVNINKFSWRSTKVSGANNRNHSRTSLIFILLPFLLCFFSPY